MLCLLLLVLSPGTAELCFICFTPLPTLKYLYIISPTSLLFSRVNDPSSLSLSFCVRYSKPSITFAVLHWTHSNMLVWLLYWGPQNWTQHYRCVSTGLSSGNNCLSRPAGSALLPDANAHGLLAATFCFSEMERGFAFNPNSTFHNDLLRIA